MCGETVCGGIGLAVSVIEGILVLTDGARRRIGGRTGETKVVEAQLL